MSLPTLMLLAAMLLQHGRYLGESKNAAIGNPAAIAAGAKLFATSCAGCHGPDGSGGRGPNLVERASWHPLSDEGIFNAIRNGLPGADMPPTKLDDDQTWKLVAFIHAIRGPAIDNDVSGNTEAGRQIFWGGKGGCSNCHSIRGQGGRMGPDLTNIGGTRPLGVIKQAVLQPSKDLTFLGNEAVTVTLANGKVIQGLATGCGSHRHFASDFNDGREGPHPIPAVTDARGFRHAVVQAGAGRPACLPVAQEPAPAWNHFQQGEKLK